MTRHKQTPETPPPPVDRAEVRRLLGLANADREAGAKMLHHPALERLGELCGVLAVYCFARWPDDHHLTAADLDRLAAQLVNRRSP